jgi:hypothetical protein
MRGQGRFAIELFAPTLLVSLLCVSFAACGSDSSPRTSGTAGKGGSGAAGNTTGAAGSTTGNGGSTGTAGSTTGKAGSTGAAGSTTGTGGSTGAGGATTGAGGSTGGSGGSATGAGGSTSGGGGTSGTAGASGASGGAGSTGAGGAGSNKPAIATMAQANGNGVMGTATFTPDGMGNITLVLQAKNCPGNGAHSFHLRVNADCGNDGMNSGMIWAKGGTLGTIMCGGGTGGMATYKTPSAGYWTIGTGDMASDILLRSVVIDMGTEAMPGIPIACGVPRQ